MHKRSFLQSAVALSLLGASGVGLAQDNVFKIGLILPMTGQQATTGRQIEAAARLWMAQNGDTIAMKYKGTLTDGTQFDSNYDSGRPFEFKLGSGQVIRGWDQGLLGMCIGEGRKLTIPPNMAYGSEGVGPIPPGATLGEWC